MAEVIATIAALRERLTPARRAGKTIGLVPTMGALHLGHRRLLEIARRENDISVATIFVNPTQFDRAEDLDRYPRTMEQDLETCRAAGVDFVFAPTAAEMYPQPQRTWIDVPTLTETLCGPGRPGHFRGVATVVMKLFQIVQPDRAYFGQKDAQQLAVIRRMVQNLNVPVQIVPVETVREPDGLAMSSRNQHLSPAERAQATMLWKALCAARDQVLAGEESAEVIRAAALPILRDVQVEYFSLVDPETLAAIEHVNGPVLIATAVWIGKTRLIDNVTVAV